MQGKVQFDITNRETYFFFIYIRTYSHYPAEQHPKSFVLWPSCNSSMKKELQHTAAKEATLNPC